jgi:hypothetical protein
MYKSSNIVPIMESALLIENVFSATIVTVPDRRRRIGPEVVAVRRWAIWVLGIWRGRGWVRGGQFTSNLRPRWTDPVTARRVPSKWKGEKGETKGN